MGNIFNPDFQEFLLALNKNEVNYVLVGGYSVIYHGFPRTTGDLDIFVEVSTINYAKLVQAFEQFQMPLFDMSEDSFLHQFQINVYTFGRPPVCIEILKEISGFTFDEIKNEDDFEMPLGNTGLLIDAMSMQYLQGASVDYKDDLQGSQFVISNPNAQSTCGCGSSFSV